MHAIMPSSSIFLGSFSICIATISFEIALSSHTLSLLAHTVFLSVLPTGSVTYLVFGSFFSPRTCEWNGKTCLATECLSSFALHRVHW